MNHTDYNTAIESHHLIELGFSETEDSLVYVNGFYKMIYEGYAWTFSMIFHSADKFIQDFRDLDEFKTFWSIISRDNIFGTDEGLL